jgi:hypothetical protein
MTRNEATITATINPNRAIDAVREWANNVSGNNSTVDAVKGQDGAFGCAVTFVTAQQRVKMYVAIKPNGNETDICVAYCRETEWGKQRRLDKPFQKRTAGRLERGVSLLIQLIANS